MRKMELDTAILTDINAAKSDSFKDSIKMIEFSKIKPSLENFYSLSELEMLADDIERQGLKHNLVVVEDINEPGTFFIKSGHRRYNAIKLLVDEGRYSSKYVPCLVDGAKSKPETVLDLIMLNATTRVMTDAELFKQYEVLKETLDELKATGVKIKGRLREKVAEMLNVSPAQVGKIENIKHNAVDEVIEAVEAGELSIATADSIAKLPEEKQEAILSENDPSEITAKKVKEHSEKKSTPKTKKVDDDAEEQNSSSEPMVREGVRKTVDLMNWAASLDKDQINYLCDGGWYNNTIKGYLIAAAQEADFSDEQIDELLNGMRMALSKNNKEAAEELYLKY